MDALNYTTKAFEFLASYTREPAVTGLGALAKASEKFILPANGCIFSDEEISDLVTNDAAPARLPYPVVVLEYPWEYTDEEARLVDDKRQVCATKRISIAAEAGEVRRLAPGVINEIHDDSDIVVFSVYSVDMSPGTAKHISKHGITAIPDGAWTPVCGYAVLRATDPISAVPKCYPLTGFADMARSKFGITDIPGIIWRDIYSEVAAVAQLLCALAMRGVHRVSVPAPAKLNAKRVRNGKAPLYSYHTLDIIIEQARGTQRGALNGDRAGPRLHTRRGHVRRLQSGSTTWVRHTVVGKGGLIQHDYNVRKQR